ncbi:MAG: xylose isomerase [Sphingobacteriales bacterium]|nr:xylose isomerase [Sphingobacteriales bacterium]
MEINNAHLTYCTNIHAGESWKEHFAAIQQHFPKIKEQVANNQAMGIGLRLSHVASLELIKKENLNVFKDWLNSQNGYVFTMNGFPYGSFHHTVVKDHVHSPDWTTNERVDYTKRLFDILKELLPTGMDGGISTSPLTYRHWFGHSPDALNEAKEKATRNILQVVEQLIQIKQTTNQVLHLDIEPEPDGLLETGDEFIDWFETSLIPIGIEVITNRFGVDPAEAEAMLKEHVRLCYDVCHFAVGYESHQEAVDNLEQKGIKIGKFQISAALKSKLSNDIEDRQDLEEAFKKYNESTYLHQVVARKIDGSLIRYRDLPDALNDIKNPEVTEWRSHFHVPVFLEDFGALQSTQSDIVEVLKIQNLKLLTPHIEVETYTWEVLPEALKLPIEECIIRELNWIKNQIV